MVPCGDSSGEGLQRSAMGWTQYEYRGGSYRYHCADDANMVESLDARVPFRGYDMHVTSGALSCAVCEALHGQHGAHGTKLLANAGVEWTFTL